jgi:hypothetical protein
MGHANGMIRAGECTEPGCGARITVSPRTGLIRKHSPLGVLSGDGWCPAGGQPHPLWAGWLADGGLDGLGGRAGRSGEDPG